MSIEIKIATTAWETFTVDPGWFGEEVEDDPDALWEAIKNLYTNEEEGDPGLAWEATSEGKWAIEVVRLDTGAIASLHSNQ